MPDNLTNQQPNFLPPRKTVLSLILGIISIILFGLPKDLNLIFLILTFVAMISSLFGLILGIEGLKSTKKILKVLTIIGMVVCTIGLLGAIYMFIGWLMMGGPYYLYP